MAHELIDRYRMEHHNEDDIAREGGLVARIYCFSPGSGHKATLFFYEEGTELAPSGITPRGLMVLRFYEHRLSDILNTLRYEKPVYVWMNGSMGRIMTHTEPIGEEEG